MMINLTPTHHNTYEEIMSEIRSWKNSTTDNTLTTEIYV